MSAPTLPLQTPAIVVKERGREAIRFENVTLAFDDKVVLDNISFGLPHGETKAVFGVAGSGKSTILKLALGLMKPDSGRIYVLGQDVTQMSENELFDLRRQIGMVFQESALFDSRTVRENVAFRLMEEGTVSDHEIERRVPIARTIVTQPEILLYDSPTGGLDPVTSTTIVELIVKQRDVYKTSSLMVTHRLQDAFIMATHFFDRNANKMLALPKGVHCEVPMAFLILRDGKVIFDGDLDELARTRDEYIREYIA